MEAEAYNFGRDEHYEHDFRYERAREFVEICRGLWDSWDDDAFIRDRASGIFSDVSKLHRLDHRGEEFRVRGPLNVPRPPQGYPVHVQAGTSEAGRGFAADYAEMMFVSPLALGPAKELYDEMRGRVAAAGRNPDHCKIMPGIAPTIGRTEAEAKEKYEYLQSLLSPEVALAFLSMRMHGLDLSKYDPDGPFPTDLPPPPPTASRTGYQNMIDRARRENLTIRQLALRQAGSLAGLSLYGSAERIADLMQEWFENGACDGFNIQPAYMPGAFDDFVELVVPILQERGLVRREYTGTTLREHFGLPRPKSRYAA
jgi:alkanesulfonate monooxygenase